MMRAVREAGWEIDADLRPEGRNGPLARSIAGLPRVLGALRRALGVPGAAAGAARSRATRRSADGSRTRRARPRVPARTASRSTGSSRSGGCASGSSASASGPPRRRSSTSSWGTARSPTCSSRSRCCCSATAGPTPEVRTTSTLQGDRAAGRAPAARADRRARPGRGVRVPERREVRDGGRPPRARRGACRPAPRSRPRSPAGSATRSTRASRSWTTTCGSRDGARRAMERVFAEALA